MQLLKAMGLLRAKARLQRDRLWAQMGVWMSFIAVVLTLVTWEGIDAVRA